VEPGDLVDIFITFNSGNEVNDTQARLLMPRVRVLAYGGASLSGPDPAEASATNRAETQARHAMLAVPVESVNELLLASRSGSLQLVLRAPKDENLPDASLFPEFAGLIPARAGLDADQRDALKLPENRAMAGLGLREFAISQTEKEQVQARAKASGEPYAAPPRRTEVIRGGRLEVIQY
jgi:pilus assembly protein CpaB